MAVSPHPSVRPTEPKSPPSDRKGQGKRESGQAGVSYGAKEFAGYEHSDEHRHNEAEYGHQHKLKTHGMGDHKSEFEGGHSFPKAGDK